MRVSWKVVVKATFFATLCSPVWIGALIPVFYLWPWVGFLSAPLIYAVLLLGAAASGFSLGATLAPWQKTRHGLIAAALTPITGGLLALFLLNYFFPPPPSDWRLIRRFERNEAVFYRLRDAVRGEGGLEAVFLKRVQPSDLRAAGISSAELTAYRAEMTRLGLVSVREHTGAAEDVTFGVEQNGSISKNYVYLRELPPQARVVERIRNRDVEAFGAVYRDLGDGWYLVAYKESN